MGSRGLLFTFLKLLNFINKSIYIAAPPNEATFLDQLKVKLASYGIEAFTGIDLSKELDDTCLSGDSQVFSSLEQEICSRSAGFLYSPGSSWSLNVAIGELQNVIELSKPNMSYRAQRT